MIAVNQIDDGLILNKKFVFFIFTAVFALSEKLFAEFEYCEPIGGLQQVINENCKQNLVQMGCYNLAEQDPSIKDLIKSCPEDKSKDTIEQLASGCAGGWNDAWFESVHATRKYLDACSKSMACKEILFNEIHQRNPTEAEKSKLKNLQSFADMDVFYRTAKQVQGSSGQQRLRFDQEIKNRKNLETGDKTSIDLPKHSFWQAVKNAIDEKTTKFQCLNTEGKTLMVCYAIFSIVDPVAATAMATKLPKLASLLKFSKEGGAVKTFIAAEKAAVKEASVVENVSEAISKTQSGEIKFADATHESVLEAWRKLTRGEAKVKNPTYDNKIGQVEIAYKNQAGEDTVLKIPFKGGELTEEGFRDYAEQMLEKKFWQTENLDSANLVFIKESKDGMYLDGKQILVTKTDTPVTKAIRKLFEKHGTIVVVDDAQFASGAAGVGFADRSANIIYVPSTFLERPDIGLLAHETKHITKSAHLKAQDRPIELVITNEAYVEPGMKAYSRGYPFDELEARFPQISIETKDRMTPTGANIIHNARTFAKSQKKWINQGIEAIEKDEVIFATGKKSDGRGVMQVQFHIDPASKGDDIKSVSLMIPYDGKEATNAVYKEYAIQMLKLRMQEIERFERTKFLDPARFIQQKKAPDTIIGK